MSKKKYYCQCRMKKKLSETSYKMHVAWIPEKFARVGKYIKIKKDDGTWEDGWEVTSAGPRRDAEIVEGRERDFLNQRKASDK